MGANEDDDNMNALLLSYRGSLSDYYNAIYDEHLPNNKCPKNF